LPLLTHESIAERLNIASAWDFFTAALRSEGMQASRIINGPPSIAGVTPGIFLISEAVTLFYSVSFSQFRDKFAPYLPQGAK
jgi:hypothetical protein